MKIINRDLSPEKDGIPGYIAHPAAKSLGPGCAIYPGMPSFSGERSRLMIFIGSDLLSSLSRYHVGSNSDKRLPIRLAGS